MKKHWCFLHTAEGNPQKTFVYIEQGFIFCSDTTLNFPYFHCHSSALLLWWGSSTVSAPVPGTWSMTARLIQGCACLRIDKDLLVDPCERLSVRAAALLIPTESKQRVWILVFWWKLLRFLFFFFFWKLLRESRRLRRHHQLGTVSSDVLFFCTLSVLLVASGPGVDSNSGEVRMWQANCRRMHNLADWISGKTPQKYCQVPRPLPPLLLFFFLNKIYIYISHCTN